MEPLASYNERLVQVRRTFDLYPDRVVINAQWRFGGRFQSTVMLAGLAPTPRAVHIRSRWARYAFWVLSAGMMILALIVYYRRELTTSLPTIAGVVITALGFIALAITYPKIPFVLFDRKDGKAGLDLARRGPDAKKFDEFVDQVRKRIRKC